VAKSAAFAKAALAVSGTLQHHKSALRGEQMTVSMEKQAYAPHNLKSQADGPVHQPLTADRCDMAHALIRERQTVSPRRLIAPGPTDEQFERMLHAAAAAPDHGLLVPWRFVLVPVSKRHLLGEVFALALIDRDPTATFEQMEDARVKAHRAPMLMLAVARLGTEEPNTPPLERMVSLGCAIQNILLSAQSIGFGSGLTSGRAMNSPQMRVLFSLCDGEEAVCFINIGTVIKSKPPRMRPTLERFISKLE
jgi:nitroreductase